MADTLQRRDRAVSEAAVLALAIEGRAPSDGRLVAARSGPECDDLGPIDGRIVAQVARCEAADVDAAIATARAAVERGEWRRTEPAAVKRVLLRLAELMRGGTVRAKTHDRSTLATPFGGFKPSGFGRDRSAHAIDKCSDLTTIWTVFR